MFFGSSTDEDVQNTPSYRKINPNCTHVNLGPGDGKLSVQGVRGLIHCFNADGGLKELETLMDRLSDEELLPVVNVLNRHLLENPSYMFQLESTFYRLKETRELDDTLLQLGKLMNNTEFVVAFIAFFKESYYERDTQDRRRLLKAVEQIGKRVNPENVATAIDLGLTYAESNALHSLMKRFRGSSPGGRDGHELVSAVRQYLVERRQVMVKGADAGEMIPVDFPVVQEVMRLLSDNGANSPLYGAFDRAFGTTEAELQVNVPYTNSVIRALTMDRDRGPIMNNLTSLFHFFNRPIDCLYGSLRVESGNLHILNRIAAKNKGDAADYIRRQSPLEFGFLKPFCDIPPELGYYYLSVVDLGYTFADGVPVMEPVSTMVKAVQDAGLLEFLVKFMSDTGVGVDADTGGLKHLIPVMSEVTDRGAWDDLTLLATLANDNGRVELADFMVFLLEGRPELDGMSIFAVLSDAFSKVSPGPMYNVAYSMRHYAESDEKVSAQALRRLRNAFYANDVHPLIGLGRDLMTSATEDQEFWDVLFKIATDHRQEVEDFFKFSARILQDGTMRELLQASVVIFHKVAQEGAQPVQAGVAPAFVSRARHELCSDGAICPGKVVTAPGIVFQDIDEQDPCRRLNLNFSLSDTDHPQYQQNLRDYLACLNHRGQYDDVVAAVDFLRSETISTGGKSFWQFQIDLVKDLGSVIELYPAELRDLMNRIFHAYDNDKRLVDFFKGTSLLIAHRVSGGADDEGGPVLRPLVDLIRPLFQKNSQGIEHVVPGLRRTIHLGGNVLVRPEFSDSLSLIQRTVLAENVDKDPVVSPPPALPNVGVDKIMREVRKWECVAEPDQQRERAATIIDDYNYAVTSWDVIAGSTRRSWTKGEFKAAVDPVFQKFTDPRQNLQTKNLLEGMLEFIQYFSQEEPRLSSRGTLVRERMSAKKHYPPSELADFLARRSADPRLILWFYEELDEETKRRGESCSGSTFCVERKPRVKLVNSLDLLELVLVASDFEYAEIINPGNNGLEFLQMIAESWGDEPRESWPQEIQDAYPPGKTPPTLAETYEEMVATHRRFSRLTGYPRVDDCAPEDEDTDIVVDRPGGIHVPFIPHWVKASLFNIAQALPVVKENLPGSGYPNEGGMRVIRDILYQIHSSTPLADRHKNAGWKNNLSAATSLSRRGIFRQLGRQARGFSANDPAYAAMIRTVVKGAGDPYLKKTMNTFFASDPDRRLLWNLLNELFDTLDSSTPLELARMKQMYLYSMAATDQLDIASSSLRQIEPVARVYYDYLAGSTDVVRDLLKSKEVSRMVRAIFEDPASVQKAQLGSLIRFALIDDRRGTDLMAMVKAIDEDPVAHGALGRFLDRFEVLKADPRYTSLGMGDRLDDLIEFLKENPIEGQPQTAAVIRSYLAARLYSKAGGSLPSDAEELMRLAARHPDQAYNLLLTLARNIDNGNIEDLMRLMRCSIEGAPATPCHE